MPKTEKPIHLGFECEHCESTDTQTWPSCLDWAECCSCSAEYARDDSQPLELRRNFADGSGWTCESGPNTEPSEEFYRRAERQQMGITG